MARNYCGHVGKDKVNWTRQNFMWPGMLKHIESILPTMCLLSKSQERKGTKNTYKYRME